MWVHTWFLSKSKLTENEIKENMIKNMEEYISDETYLDFYFDMDTEIYNDIKKHIKKTALYLEEFKNKENLSIADIKEIDNDIWFFIKHTNEWERYTIINNELYFEPNNNKYHDIFRIITTNYDFEELEQIRLWSYIETIEFIKNNKCEQFVDNYDNKLKTFWEKNPEWVIIFW